MKVSVITLQNVKNYGSVLQAFATQEKLKQFTDDVEIIDYRRKDTTLKWKLKKCFPKRIYWYPFLIRYEYILGKFVKKHLKLTNNTYYTDDDFKRFPIHDGIYFTGSDQVWNTGWNQGVVAPFYLSFLPEGKRRFAYMASFGKERVEDESVAQTKQYISRYERIAVREESALKILSEQYNYNNAISLVDPTLVMPPEFWRKYTKEPEIKGDYILIYQLNKNKEFEGYAKEMSKRTGIKLVRLCVEPRHLLECGKSVVLPDIFNFIKLIDNARYVLTDSFHGTAFSMNLNTEVVCVYPQKYSTRLSNILRLVGAEHRAVKSFDDFYVINRPIDFSHVNTVLARERNRADEYLSEIFRNKSCDNKKHNDYEA